MSLKIFLLKYPTSPKQRGHFAIWAPSDDDKNIGKIVQVLGTPFTGFVLDIQRDFDIGKAQPKPAVIELGSIVYKYIADDHKRHLPDTEAEAVDKLESVARTVTPPVRSKNPFIADSKENRRCQEWTAEYVHRLILEGILPSTAADVVEAYRDFTSVSASGV